MKITQSEFPDGGDVQLGSVSLVLVELVFGETRGESLHHRVSPRLCNDGRERDNGHNRVAMNDSFLLILTWRVKKAIQKHACVVRRCLLAPARRERANAPCYRLGNGLGDA